MRSPITNSSGNIERAPSSSLHQIDDAHPENECIMPRSPRTVQFALCNQVKEIVNINDLKTMADISALWYTESEYKAIKYDIMETIMGRGRRSPRDKRHQCFRGLENMTMRGRLIRRQQVVSAIQAVLDEQTLQRYEGIYDPHLLADVYSERTYRCQSSAKRIALQDSTQIL